MPSKHGNQVEVGTLILKVASRCNLACDYCYIYTSQDSSWKNMPRYLPDELIEPLVYSIKNLHERQELQPNIVLHGGEPLLSGISFLTALLEQLRSVIPKANISIQSNGTIYTHKLAQILKRYHVSLSFSVDGFQHQNDRHRLSIKGVSAYPRISENIYQALGDENLYNILMVVDFNNSPNEIYNFITTSGVHEVNLILPDGDHNNPPSNHINGAAGSWLWKLFKLYVENPCATRIRFFDDVVKMMLKKCRNLPSPPVTYSVCSLTIDTDGTIKQSDTFRINGERADYIGDYKIGEASIVDVANSEINIEFLHRVETLCDSCSNCDFVGVCGGGYPSHRLKSNSFQNPSVYCSDYLYFFERLERALCETQQR